MKNIKKIGLSALAGALAMTSAHAGALSVTGSMEISYTKGSNETTSNPLGQANDITLKGSTELDNGVTVSYKNTSSDTTLTGDSELAFGNILGGTLAMTSAGAPISGIDNKTPTAFKDAEGMVGSITDVNGGDGTYGIRYTLADVGGSGIKLDYMYFPVHGTGDATGDEGFSGGGHGNLDAHDITLTGAVPGVEGLNVGAGYYRANYNYTGSNDTKHEGTAYATYAYGPLTFGYQVGAVGGAGAGGVGYKNEYMGVSYAISDDLSVSYNNTESKKVNAGWSPESDYDSFSLSYSMGGMTINIADADCSNCSYTNAKSQDERTISMSIAF
jgi:outer membrane protein OmpU